VRISSVAQMLRMVDDKTEQSEERFWRTFFYSLAEENFKVRKVFVRAV